MGFGGWGVEVGVVGPSGVARVEVEGVLRDGGGFEVPGGFGTARAGVAGSFGTAGSFGVARAEVT